MKFRILPLPFLLWGLVFSRFSTGLGKVVEGHTGIHVVFHMVVHIPVEESDYGVDGCLRVNS